MLQLRALIRQRRMLAIFIVALALCVKALIPTGYMVGTNSTMLLSVQICDDGTRSLSVMGASATIALGLLRLAAAHAPGAVPPMEDIDANLERGRPRL
jgi:hypothetical protein